MQLFFLLIGFTVLGGLSMLVTLGVLAVIGAQSTPIIVLISVISTFVVMHILASVAEVRR